LSKLSRDKGKRFEQATVNWFKAIDLPAKRCLQFRGEEDGPDVRVELPSGLILAVECKHWKRVNWRKAFAQSQTQAGPIVLNAVRAKDDRCEPVWILSERTMMELLHGWQEDRGVE
jgi:hypothetical protein